MSEDHKGDNFFMFTILSMLKEGKNPPNTSFSFQIDQDPKLVQNLLKISGNISKGFGLGLPSGIFSSRQYKHVTLSQVSGLEVFQLRRIDPYFLTHTVVVC